MAKGQCVSALINMEDAFGSYGEMTASLEGAGVEEESWAPEYMEVFGQLNSAHVDFEQKCLVPGERMLSGLRRRRR